MAASPGEHRIGGVAVPEISRRQIEYAVPQLERAIKELTECGRDGAAMNLQPILVCMMSAGGWYDDVPSLWRGRKKPRRHRLDTV
jgi:hypothetical protein